ncbi:MAG: hypothetical protein ACOC1X_03000 [Promethearchaeota archaeon]
MRYYPEDVYDWNDVDEINVKEWQLKLLNMNPEYCNWGNYEDYMKDGKGWNSSVFYNSWSEFEWELNELNELVNFYFDVYRPNKNCDKCKRGLNPETEKIFKSFYRHKNGDRGWVNDLTEDDYQKLADRRNKTVEEIKQREKSPFGFDSIDHFRLTEIRARRKGVYGKCKKCDGKSYIYTSKKAKVGLQLWMIHPRKGCSRGIYVKNVRKQDIPEVIDYLEEARKRNNKRFSKLDKGLIE